MYIEEAQEICRGNEEIGCEGIDYAILLEFKGDFFYLSDKLDESYECFKDAYNIYDVINSKHEGAANALKQMSKIFEVQGRYDTAYEILCDCINKVELGDADNRGQLLIEL